MIWTLIKMVAQKKKNNFIWQLSNTEKHSVSSSSRKRAFGKYNKPSLSLDEKIEILDENNRKRKMSYKDVADEFK